MPLHIRFNKIDVFIRAYDRTRYLVLFGSGKHNSIYNRIKCLRSIKSGHCTKLFEKTVFPKKLH